MADHHDDPVLARIKALIAGDASEGQFEEGPVKNGVHAFLEVGGERAHAGAFARGQDHVVHIIAILLSAC